MSQDDSTRMEDQEKIKNSENSENLLADQILDSNDRIGQINGTSLSLSFSDARCHLKDGIDFDSIPKHLPDLN